MSVIVPRKHVKKTTSAIPAHINNEILDQVEDSESSDGPYHKIVKNLKRKRIDRDDDDKPPKPAKRQDLTSRVIRIQIDGVELTIAVKK
jgi:hypothetical protein